MSSTASSTAAATSSSSDSSGSGSGSAQSSAGLSVVAFFTALSTSLVIFAVQLGIFLLLRNKLARIFKPKSFLVPERERTDPPPARFWNLLIALMRFKDREIIKKCGLDAFFFLRYLQTLLFVFVPIAIVVIPILIPINYVGGLGQSFTATLSSTNSSVPSGLDTIAWGNVRPANYNRYWAHLALAVLVIVWVCFVFFCEMRVYIKVRQDYLTSAEHRLRASANTVLVSGIPDKWLTKEALRGLFDVFPGGIRNIWLTRDYTKLLDKVHKREKIHQLLEAAESELIRAAKKMQLKKRAAEEKKARKKFRAGHATKADREQREREENERAQRMAEGEGGLSFGNQNVPQIDGLQDDASISKGRSSAEAASDQQLQRHKSVLDRVPKLGAGFSKVGSGLKDGVVVVGKTGHGISHGIIGGAKTLHNGVDSQLEWTGGFEFVNAAGDRGPGSSFRPVARDAERPRPGVRIDDSPTSQTSQPSTQRSAAGHQSKPSDTSSLISQHKGETAAHGNTTRKVTNWDDAIAIESSKWWQFWKPPSGAYASPIPQGYDAGEFPLDASETGKDGKNKSAWARIRAQMPFFRKDDDVNDYPPIVNPDFLGDEKEDELAEWKKWLDSSDRPTYRVPIFDWTPGWLPGLPFVNKKVDAIYYCRKELARLNMEIEEDQQDHNHERYPIMNSAFIQFNNQVAAHMACQSVTHHVPKHMSPRVVEISPDDVIWDNMAIRWWDEWIRTFIVIGVVFSMTILWAFPVAFSSSLSQIDSLVAKYPWLDFIENNALTYDVAKAVAGVLPTLILSILLALVPVILDFLATFQGSKTGSQKAEYVQVYYFFFLFVQVFLVVSIASGTIATLQDTVKNVQGIPQILAKNLPKAANYFFSYMILQALSTSSGTLLQVSVLLVWYILARIVDDTARSKWKRQTELPSISWGSFFPVYTNFACIALVYSVIAPLISVFAIITFTLLWFAHRYNMIYVTRFKIDTGGVLYPRAINQTFTGLYFMELCLIGLFFLVRDEDDNASCVAQAIIMIVAAILTVLYQVLLNWSFGPLLRYLPITFEDEAVLRDEIFQRALDRRMGLVGDDVASDDEAATLTAADSRNAGTTGSVLRDGSGGVDVELQTLGERGRQGSFGLANRLNPVRGIVHAGTWAAQGGKKVRNATLGRTEHNLQVASKFRRERRQKDLEAQRAIGDALYGGFNDEIEDLTPEERDVLVREAFKHSALRARRPTVWLPRDDIGVSDDEIRHACNMSDYIWISNEGTALDSKVRVVYGRAPPDFSDIELINL